MPFPLPVLPCRMMLNHFHVPPQQHVVALVCAHVHIYDVVTFLTNVARENSGSIVGCPSEEGGDLFGAILLFAQKMHKILLGWCRSSQTAREFPCLGIQGLFSPVWKLFLKALSKTHPTCVSKGGWEQTQTRHAKINKFKMCIAR